MEVANRTFFVLLKPEFSIMSRDSSGIMKLGFFFFGLNSSKFLKNSNLIEQLCLISYEILESHKN
jgi:hypothetical protein